MVLRWLHEGEVVLKVYTIKLPRFLGGIVKAVLGTFTKDS
ncbi:stage V sporulation protein SpoVM [Alicyclobacillus sacchari]